MADAISLLGGSGGSSGGINIAQLLQALSPILLGSGNTTGTSTQGGSTSSTVSTSIDPQIQALIQQLIGGTQTANAGYTKDAAISDSQSIINQIVKGSLESNMPSILSGNKAAGIYNSTTQDLLSNDLQARIAGQAAQAAQSNIASYAGITGNNNQLAGNLATTLANNTKTQTQTGTTQQAATTTQQTSPVVGKSAMGNLGALAGGLGGLQGLSTLKGALPWDKIFGGSSGGALGSGDVFSSIAGSIDPGNTLNGGYGIVSGLGGSSISDLTSSLNLGAGLGDSAINSGYNFADLAGRGSGASDIAGVDLSSVGTSLANAGSSLASGIGDISTSIGSGLNNAWDWLSDAGSSIGDWFGGFFANGGQVPTAEALRSQITERNASKKKSKTEFANGGQVGRPGQAAYTADAKAGRTYDLSQALWEEITSGSGMSPVAEAPNTVTAPEVNDQTGATFGYNDATAQGLTSAIQKIRAQMDAAQSAAPTDSQFSRLVPRDEQEALSTVVKARSDYTGGQNLLAAATTAPGQSVSIASGLEGASSALTGVGGAAAPSAGFVGEGIGAASGVFGAATEAPALVAGSGELLPGIFGPANTGDYGLAAYLGAGGSEAAAAGSGGSAAAGAGVADSGAGLAGLGAGLAGAGFFAVAALAAQGLIGGLMQWNDPKPTTRDRWLSGAANDLTSNSGVLRGAAVGDKGLQSNTSREFFQQYYNGIDFNDPAAVQAAYNAAQASILDPGFVDVANKYSGYGSDYSQTTDQLSDIQGIAQYLNQQIAQNQGGIGSKAFANLVAYGDPGAKEDNSNVDPYTIPLQQNVSADAGGGSVQQYSNNYGSRPDGSTWNPTNQAYEMPRAESANGGLMGRGAGTGAAAKADPQGKADNIPIMVSGGEYVVPKSVVDILGPEFFDGLVSKFHVPFDDKPPTK